MSKKIFLRTWVFVVLCVSSSMAYAGFVHPGCIHSQADLDRIKEKVNAKVSPWIDGWNAMLSDSKSSASYVARPSTTIGGSDGTRQQAARDATAAYYNIMQWYVTGDEAHARCAVNILNAWSAKINAVVTGELFQLPIAIIVQAAEICRLYPGWAAADQQRFKDMCTNYFYPACHAFIGKCGSWPGWDGPAMACILYMGVFCDNQSFFDEAVNYYKNGNPDDGNGGGRLTNMVCQPTGQSIEMGRDMPHAEIGPAAAAEFCQTAYIQGVDLFALEDNLLLKSFEYLYKYNLAHEIDYKPYDDCDGKNLYYPAKQYAYRITGVPAVEIIYNHYVVRKGLSAPYCQAAINLRGFDCGWESPDYVGFSFTLDEAKSPYTTLPKPGVPTGLKAVGGLDRVMLSWILPDWHTVSGSVIQRSNSADGPFVTVGTWTFNTSNFFTDTTAVGGKTYYYRVAVTNRTASSDYCAPVMVRTATPEVLPDGWQTGEVGTLSTATSARFTPDGERSIEMYGAGVTFGAKYDEHGFVYKKVTGDCVLTCYLVDGFPTDGSATNWNLSNRAGLIMRSSLSSSSPMVSVSLGDNFRTAWLTYRTTDGSACTWKHGDTHTFAPVWFRLVRSGSTFTAYQSRDGKDWLLINQATVTMPKVFYVGLLANSGISTAGVSAKTYFDHVTLTGRYEQTAAAPTSLTAKATSSQSVKLSWNSVQSALAYEVERAEGMDGTFQTVAVSCRDTFFVDNGLTPQTNYQYRVRSINMAGAGADSACVSVQTPALQLPAAAERPSVTVGNASVLVTWNAVPDAASYIVQRATSEAGPYSNVDTLSTLSFTDSKLTVGTTYYYRIVAANALGAGEPSEAASVTVTEIGKLTGTHIGTAGSYGGNASTTFEAALDGNLGTFFDASVADGAYVGLDMGRNRRAVVSQVRFAPRSGYPARMNGGHIQAATKADFSDAVDIYTLTSAPAVGTLTRVAISSYEKYRFLRYVSPAAGWGNIAELEFWGHAVTLTNQTITFNAIADKLVGDADFVPDAQASSGLPLTFVSSDASVASVVNGRIRIVGGGTCTITASQEGNDVFGTAEPQSRTLTVMTTAVGSVDAKDAMILSPNPCTDQVTVALPEGVSAGQCTLYSLDGRKMWTKTLTANRTILSVNGLTSGCYLVQMNCAGKSYSTKLVRE